MKKVSFLAFALVILLFASSSGSAVSLETECGFVSPFIGKVADIAIINNTHLIIPVLDDANFVSLGYKLGTGDHKYIDMSLDQIVIKRYLDNEDSTIFPRLFRDQDHYSAAPGMPEQLGLVMQKGDIYMQTKTEQTICGDPFMRAYNKKGKIRFLYAKNPYPFKFKELTISPMRGGKISCTSGVCQEKVIFSINKENITLIPGDAVQLNKYGIFSLNLIWAESAAKDNLYILEYVVVFDDGILKEKTGFWSKVLSWIKFFFNRLF